MTFFARARRGGRFTARGSRRAAAAEVRIGDREKLHARNRAQEIARLARDALGVREVTRVVIRDPEFRVAIGKRLAQPQAGEEHGHIDDHFA